MPVSRFRGHRNRSKSCSVKMFLLLFLLTVPSAVHGATVEDGLKDELQISEGPSRLNLEDLGLFGLPLEEIMNVKVEVASLFLENELVVGSSVYGMKDGIEEPGISALLRAGYTF